MNTFYDLDSTITNKHIVSRDLNDMYKGYLNCLCFTGEDLVIFKKIYAEGDTVKIAFRTFKTPEEMISVNDYYNLTLKYGDDFLPKLRSKFLQIKHQLKIFGFEINPVK